MFRQLVLGKVQFVSHDQPPGNPPHNPEYCRRDLRAASRRKTLPHCQVLERDDSGCTAKARIRNLLSTNQI